MATVNSNGDVILERQMSDYERMKALTLSTLKYPKHRRDIERLRDDDFRYWIYSMPALEALKVCSTRKFSWMMKRRNKWWNVFKRRYF